MTNEEAIANLEFLMKNCTDETIETSINIAIKALKIQRIGHWEYVKRHYNSSKKYTGEDVITGEKRTIRVYKDYEIDMPYCSECGCLAGDTSLDFCCVCGTDMRESLIKEVANEDND